MFFFFFSQATSKLLGKSIKATNKYSVFMFHYRQKYACILCKKASFLAKVLKNAEQINMSKLMQKICEFFNLLFILHNSSLTLFGAIG